jgi:hypothetical protein
MLLLATEPSFDDFLNMNVGPLKATGKLPAWVAMGNAALPSMSHLAIRAAAGLDPEGLASKVQEQIEKFIRKVPRRDQGSTCQPKACFEHDLGWDSLGHRSRIYVEQPRKPGRLT